mmetsp:Transcript_5880/g.7632  ORF Transcript_5880/g.7632 Transcript_5880/m.7632 type:complete len:193 (-) Transcript_5880:238-816(-)
MCVALFILFSLVICVNRYFGMPLASSQLPGLLHMIQLFCGAHLFNDVGVYWSHRMFHSKMLYRRFHKKHHSFRASVFGTSEYSNPIEGIIAAQLPALILVMGLGCHPLIQTVWIFLRMTQTYEVHSGYHLDNSLIGRLGLTCGGAFHDYHHSTNRGNFGADVVCDWLFGTMDHWVRDGGVTGYCKRHGVIVS